MDEDDEYKALRQVLAGRCPGAKFKDDDVKKLVDAGYDRETALVAATKDDLGVVFLGRPGVVTVLLNAFVQPAGLAGELPQGLQHLQVFVREAAKNYKNLKPGMNEAEKFLLVSRDPFGDYMCPFLIWIRECYRDLQKVLQTSLASNLHHRFIIVGTEGIGKSVFSIFWVCYLATQRLKVAWKTHLEHIFILDFSQEVATVSGPFKDYSHDAVQSVVNDPFAWLILDGQQSDRLRYNCRMLLTCSAKSNNYTSFLKNSYARRLYLPVWAEEELDQFCDDLSEHQTFYGAMDVPVKEKVQAYFKELGGVPRYILRNLKLEEGSGLLAEAIRKLSVDLCWKLLSGNFEQGLSDKIIHMCVGNVEGKCNYDNCIYTFASSKAQMAVWEHLRSQAPLQLVKIISQYWDDASCGSVVGVLYEVAAHEILRRGGTFKRKRVWEVPPYETQVSNLVLGKLESSNFDELQELKNMKNSVYCKPTSSNFESVDAVIGPDSSVDVPRLVQIFKRKNGGQNHGYKLQGLKNVDDVLKSKRYELLSCVPSECYNETKFQTWRNKNGEKCVQLTGDKETLVAKMDQYVVAVDYKTLVETEASA